MFVRSVFLGFFLLNILFLFVKNENRSSVQCNSINLKTVHTKYFTNSSIKSKMVRYIFHEDWGHIFISVCLLFMDLLHLHIYTHFILFRLFLTFSLYNCAHQILFLLFSMRYNIDGLQKLSEIGQMSFLVLNLDDSCLDGLDNRYVAHLLVSIN